MQIQQALQLHIRHIVQAGMLQEGDRVKATVHSGTRLCFDLEANWTQDSGPFLQLRYIHSIAGLQEYRIDIEARRSNLGTGRHFYLICPVTGRRARTLYMAYNFPKFKARDAYHVRLYYPLQLTGGRSRYVEQHTAAKERLEKLQQQKAYTSHKGCLTRYGLRLQRAENLISEYDLRQWTIGLPAVVARHINRPMF